MADELSLDEIDKYIQETPEPPDVDVTDVKSIDQYTSEELKGSDIQGTIKYWGDTLQRGAEDIGTSGRNWDAAMNPFNAGWTQEQFLEHVTKGEGKDEQAQALRLQSIEDNMWFLDPRSFVGEGLKQIPVLGEAIKGGGAGSIVGGLGGAAVGGLTGKTPMAALAGARAGIGVGSKLGTWYAVSRIEGGEIFSTAIKAGASPTAARIAAATGGGMSGAVEMFSLKFLPRQMREGAARAILSKSGPIYAQVQNFARTYVSGLPKEVILQVGQEELQNVIIQGTAYKILSLTDDGPEAQRKLDEAFVNQWAHAWDTATSTAKGTIALGLGARFAGRLGSTVGGIREYMDPTKRDIREARVADVLATQGLRGLLGKELSLSDKVDLIKQVFTMTNKEVREMKTDTDKITDEDIDAWKDISQAEALDILAKPDEQLELRSQADALRLTLRGLREKTATPEVAKRTVLVEEQLRGLQSRMAEVESLREGVLDSESKTTLQAKATVTTEASPKEPSLAEFSAQLDADVADIQAQFKQDPAIVQGRIKKLKSDMEAIDARINDLEQRLVADVADDKAIKATQRKVDGLYQKRMLADNELMGLQTGFGIGVRDEDVVEIRAGKILLAKAKAVSESLRQFQKGKKAGALEATQDITRVQSALTGFIKSAKLEKADKDAFLGKVTRIKTDAQLAKAMPSIAAQMRKAMEISGYRAATARLKKLLKTGALKKGGKHPEGKLTPEVQAIVSAAKTFSEGIGTISRQVEPLMEKERQGLKMTLDEWAQLYIGMLIGDASMDNAQGINKLSDILTDAITTGRAEFIKAKIEKAEALAQDIKYAVGAIQGKNPVDIKQSESQVTPRTTGKLVYRMLDWWNSHQGIWDGILHAVTLDSSVERGLRVVDEFGTAKASAAERKLNNELTYLLEEDLKEALETDAAGLRRYLRGANMLRAFGTYTDTEGNKHDLITNKLNLITRWRQKDDPQRVSNLLLGNKLSDEYWTLLDKKLDEKDKAFAATLTKHYRRLYDVANAAWEKRYGVSLPYNEFYTPSRVEGYAREFSSTLGLDSHEHKSIIPGAAITRTENDLALAPMNAYSAAMSHVSQWSHFIAWGDTLQANSRLLADEDFRKAVTLKFGQATYQTMRQHNDTFIQNRSAINEGVSQAFNKFRSAMFVVVLGWKFLQAPIQLVSSFAAQGRYSVNGKDVWVDVSDVLDALVDLAVLKDPYETLGKSELMRARGVFYEPAIRDMSTTDVQPIDWAVEHAIPEKMRKLFPTHLEMVQAMMMPITIGDRGGIYGGGWAIYKKVLAETGDADAALQVFEDWANNTQQSTDLDRLSMLQKGTALTKSFVDYMNAPFQAARWVVDGWITLAKSNKRPGDIANFVTRALTAWMLIPALIYGVKNGFADDEDEEKWVQGLLNVLLSPTDMIPIFGDFIEYSVGLAVTTAVGGKPYEPKNPGLAFGVDVAKFTGAIVKAIKDEDEDGAWTKAFDKTLIPIGAYLSLPLGNIVKSFTGLWGLTFGSGDTTPDAAFAKLMVAPDSIIRDLEESGDSWFFGDAVEAAQGFLEEAQEEVQEDEEIPVKSDEDYEKEAAEALGFTEEDTEVIQ